MSAHERVSIAPSAEFSMPVVLAIEQTPTVRELGVESLAIAIDPIEFVGEDVGSPMANALAGAKREITRGLLQSRADRIKQEAVLEADMHPVRRLFRSTPGDLLFKPVIEAIPGVGDAITFTSAVKGRDVLTGRELVRWQRLAYGAASLFPFIPSAAIIGPIEGAKWLAEELVHAGVTRNARVLFQPKLLLKAVKAFT